MLSSCDGGVYGIQYLRRLCSVPLHMYVNVEAAAAAVQISQLVNRDGYVQVIFTGDLTTTLPIRVMLAAQHWITDNRIIRIYVNYYYLWYYFAFLSAKLLKLHSNSSSLVVDKCRKYLSFDRVLWFRSYLHFINTFVFNDLPQLCLVSSLSQPANATATEQRREWCVQEDWCLWGNALRVGI